MAYRNDKTASYLLSQNSPVKVFVNFLDLVGVRDV